MAYNESLLTVTAFLSAGISGLTAVLAVTRSRGGARVAGDALAGVAVAAALWAVTFGLRVAAGDPETARIWLRAGLVVSAPIPTFLLVFGLYQTGHTQTIDQRVAALLAVEPTAAASLALTNPLHGAYVSEVTTVAVDGTPAIGAVPGTFLSGHLTYGFLLGGVTAVLFGSELLRTHGPYRRQAALILAAVAVPMVTLVAYLTDLPVAPSYDTTPVWFGLSTLLLLVAMRTYGLFDISPVAHETVFEEIDDAIVIVDDRDRIVDANPAAESAFGLAEGDLSRPATDVLHNPSGVEALLAEGEATLTTPDDRHYEATRTDIDVGGASNSHVLVFRDVTDRERVERRFRTYIEQSNDVLVVLDEEGAVEYASAAAERVFGHDPDVLSGRSIFSLVHPDDQSDIHRVFRSVTDGGRVVGAVGDDSDEERQPADRTVGDATSGDGRESESATSPGGRESGSATSPGKRASDGATGPGGRASGGTSQTADQAQTSAGGVPRDGGDDGAADGTERERFRIKHGDGGWRTVEAVVAAGVGATEDRLLVNIRDVTDRQRYEQRLRVLNRVLRHDLRNDANVVLGYADLLLKSDLDPAVRERAEAVRRKANRLVELGEQAREVDRTLHAEGGEAHEIDLKQIVDSVAWRARETFPEAQVDTDTPDEVSALGNDLVESALWHLVSNGIYHNDSEEPWVRVSVDRGEEWVRISVTDDGPGIPESERKVLDHGTETALEHGSGLGLWLVKWITDSVGGDVSFAERDPRGSIVTVQLAAPVDAGPATEQLDTATAGDDS